jgi:NAD(P)-dependent dehydrogenase (short-subunit alcohol dehydrogenase family)
MEHQTIIVTGGAGVLGMAVVARLAAEGARVVVMDKTSRDTVPGATLVFGVLDVTDPAETGKAMLTVREQLGGLHGLVNIAGTFRWERLEDGSVDTWDLLYTVNLKSAVVATKAALPHLLETKGCIVNIGANGAARGSAGMGPYAASKAGVARLTESLAEEVKGRGVRVNAVLPSIIDTPQNRADMPDADYSRWVSPSALADVIAFLLSPQSAAITGACIPVTGLV